MTKVLSRDAIQRMISQRGGTTTVSGGGGEGGASAAWVEGNYVAKNYWNQLFKIHGKQTTTVDGEVTDEQDITLPPNTMPSRTETTDGGVTTVVETTITRIEALFDFNSVGGVSALGYNPGGGGGGGADLNKLLDNINSSNIGDIEPGASEVGKCLVYNGNNQWAWATPGGGGGGIDNISVASTGLLTGGSVSGSSIILTTRAIQASDLPDLSGTYVTWANVNRTSYSSWNKIPFVNSGGSMDIGKTLEFHSSNGDSTDYNAVLMLDSSKTYSAVALTLPNTSGTLATQTWVNQQGFVKSSGVTSVGLSMPTGFSVSDSPITSSGTLSVGIASGYFMPTTTQRTTWNNKQDAISDLATIRSNAANGQTAYGWGNHADQGYLKKTEGMVFGISNNYVPARFTVASGAYDDERAAKAQGDGYIEWWSTGGYFNHEMGWIRAKGNVEVGTSATDTSHYLQIGGGRLYWDNTNNALYVQKVDSQGNVTAANFYATGGVSALGMSVGGTPSMNALTLQTLTVNGSATINTLAVTNTIESLDVGELTIVNQLMLNGNNIYMDGGNIEDAYQVKTTQMIVGSGGSTIKRIYWDGTYLQVQIGTTTYKFRPDATA